jgi:hypothetical protein
MQYLNIVQRMLDQFGAPLFNTEMKFRKTDGLTPQLATDMRSMGASANPR